MKTKPKIHRKDNEMTKITVPKGTGEQVAKEMLWLAWNASRVFGMGYLRDRPDAGRDDVWTQANEAGDYDGFETKKADPNQVRGDYVFGRMMKITFEYGDDFVSFHNRKLSPDYQSWCAKYPMYSDLVKAALDSLDHQKVAS